MWRFSGNCAAILLAASVLQGCAAGAARQEADAQAIVPSEAAVQRFAQAVSALDAGELTTAEQGFREVTAAYPEFAAPFINLGILHTRAARFEEAEQAFKAALEREPANAVAYNQLGILYRQIGRFRDADTAYQEAVRLDPAYAIAHLNLGVLCDLYLRQPQRALEHYEQYLALAESPQPQVNDWVAELKLRLGPDVRSARTNP